jgi:hypothetical protein
MIISTSSHNILLSGELDRFVSETMHQALDRLGNDVLSVDVFLKDVNGPKGGIDKQVIARLHLRSRRQMVIETVDGSLHAAIRRTAKRAKRSVRRSMRKFRRVEKLRMHRRLGDNTIPSSLGA